MKNSKQLVTALIYAIIGVLFIILKGGVLNILMTIVGAGLIIWGIVDLVNKDYLWGIIKMVVGIALILLGWLAVSIVLYILGIVLIIYAAIEIYDIIKNSKKDAIKYVIPVLTLIVGILLLFAQGDIINLIFIICGIILIIDAILILVPALSKKKTTKKKK